ncbi:hypothetical protein UFOVP27_141, partial [uncultured Caudovirales phage]
MSTHEIGVLLTNRLPNSHHWELGAYSGYYPPATLIIESETRSGAWGGDYYQVVIDRHIGLASLRLQPRVRVSLCNQSMPYVSL